MSTLLYKEEHFGCYNYLKDGKLPIESLKLKNGEIWENIVEENVIVFLIEGCISISCGDVIDRIVDSKKMFVLRKGFQYKADVIKDTFIMTFQFDSKISFCDKFSIEQLYIQRKKGKGDLELLTINEEIGGFLHLTLTNISEGLKCTHFLDIKKVELFLLLRAYYTKEELAVLFSSLLNQDLVFSKFVYDSYYKVKNIQELVALSHYSMSTFNKRFRKSFGVSPYKWLKAQKAKRLFHEINNYTKNFKEISEEYGFSSVSQFNDFCKANYGCTPGQIRKKRKNNLDLKHSD